MTEPRAMPSEKIAAATPLWVDNFTQAAQKLADAARRYARHIQDRDRGGTPA